VTLKDCFKFSMEALRFGLFGIIAEPGEENCAASKADPRNVSFLIGPGLANVDQKRTTVHRLRDLVTVWHFHDAVAIGTTQRTVCKRRKRSGGSMIL